MYDEMENALWNESLSQGEYVRLQVLEWASNYGEDHPDQEWLTSPFDTIERNPHYDGPSTPKPEI